MKNSKVNGSYAERALREAVAEAIERHRLMGVPAAFSRNGKVWCLMPDGSEKLASEVDWDFYPTNKSKPVFPKYPRVVNAEDAEQALKEAVAGAIERHKRMGVPVAFSRDGQVYLLMPDGTEQLAPKIDL